MNVRAGKHQRRVPDTFLEMSALSPRSQRIEKFFFFFLFFLVCSEQLRDNVEVRNCELNSCMLRYFMIVHIYGH